MTFQQFPPSRGDLAFFADFVVLRTLASYGGAEVWAARRVHDLALSPVVHLGLLGTDARTQARAVAIAQACAALKHADVLRVTDVCIFDGATYAVAEACDALDLATAIEDARQRGLGCPAPFALAVGVQLAQLVLELHELGDVWAQHDAGLAGLFPSGARLDGIAVTPQGRVVLRALAGTGSDQPTVFRAPELAHSRPTVACDVYAIMQVVRALLGGGADLSSQVRFPQLAEALPTLVVGCLADNPEDRPRLDAVLLQLKAALAANAPGRSASAVLHGHLSGGYRVLTSFAAVPEPDAAALAPLRQRLRQTLAMVRTVYPTRAPAHVTLADAKATVKLPPISDDSDAVGRVFTDDEGTLKGDRGLGSTFEAAVRAPVAVVYDDDEAPTEQHALAPPQPPTAQQSAVDSTAVCGVEVVELSGFGEPPTLGPRTPALITLRDDDDDDDDGA